MICIVVIQAKSRRLSRTGNAFSMIMVVTPLLNCP
jgi:hypothetical protein